MTFGLTFTGSAPRSHLPSLERRVCTVNQVMTYCPISDKTVNPAKATMHVDFPDPRRVAARALCPRHQRHTATRSYFKKSSGYAPSESYANSYESYPQRCFNWDRLPAFLPADFFYANGRHDARTVPLHTLPHVQGRFRKAVLAPLGGSADRTAYPQKTGCN